MFSNCVLLSLILLICRALASNQLSSARKCELICTAECISGGQQLDVCQTNCEAANSTYSCPINDTACWETCNEHLDGSSNGNVPEDIFYSFTPSSALNISWNNYHQSIYLFQFSLDDNFSAEHEYILTQPYILNWAKDIGQFCDEVAIRIASISSAGVSNFTGAFAIDAPIPQMSANLKINSTTFIDKPFVSGDYRSNGTVKLVFEFARSEWPIGVSDLKVEPLFHMIYCDIVDLSVAVPSPQFFQENGKRLVWTELGADVMYRGCTFMYQLEEVHSKQCGTTLRRFDDESQVMKTIKIECDSVDNNPCTKKPERHPPPICNRVESFHFEVLNPAVDANNLDTNITISVAFQSTLQPPKIPVYHIAFYGNAIPFRKPVDTEFLGVNLTDILGNTTDCPLFNDNGTCAVELNLVNVSMRITDLRMEKLYGVIFCAVMDVQNVTMPDFRTAQWNLKMKAHKVYVQKEEYIKSKVGIIVSVCSAALAAIFVITFVVFFKYHRKQKQKMKMNQFKLQQLKLENEQRYTDFPRKHDLWELERRNLIIYDDKKLGSGAFGAVYMGRLIGVARGHKDAQSTLGINLMRAENCDVAVKMLPEYADQISKSEFLKEIALMKTLGYHERLVNMLACIAETEPYCLVVEFCSDGDLLHFLRERCEYMLGLTDAGIDYGNPTSEAEFDIDMIITLKQLLMFAVQISYGLEYLSQKGFVHRDVAARNVLVHGKTNAKIGDFGLCRYIYAESANYKGKGGRLPVKWMSPEAIKHYEFTTKSDVWSFGILMFEIITLGGSPYPGIQPDDMMEYLDTGKRMDQPDNCPDNFYEVMNSCWAQSPGQRPEFGSIRQRLATQLEDVTDEYSYLKLDAQRDYYNVTYGGAVKDSPSQCDSHAIKEFDDAELAKFDTIPLSTDHTKALPTIRDKFKPSLVPPSSAVDNDNDLAESPDHLIRDDGGETNAAYVV